MFAIASLLTVSLTIGCSGRGVPRNDLDGETTSSAGPGIEPHERLRALGEAWLRTPATISYRATAPVPGQPSSTHQCLRQLVTSVDDREEALRRCNQQGRMKLTWDPPDRWRMDVTSPIERVRILSTTTGSVLCPGPAEDDRSCRSIRSREARMASPFEFILLTPDEVLHRIGAPGSAVVISLGTGSVAEPVECFRATGRRGHVEWCYSADDLLLSFLSGSATDGWISLEATDVSPASRADAFELPRG